MEQFKRDLIQFFLVIVLTAGVAVCIGGLWYAFCAALGIDPGDDEQEDERIYDDKEEIRRG